MRYDLAALVRRAGTTRRRFFVARAIVPTRAQERAALNIYMRIVRGWHAQWRDQIEPAYTRTLGAGVRDSVDDVTMRADAAGGTMTRLAVALEADMRDWTVEVERWHRGQFATSFTPVGVRLDTMLGAGDVAAPLKATLAENVALIRSLNDQMRNGISGAVFRGLTNRTPARDVAREIRKITGIGKRRAELIAADQLQKLSARLDQERQEQAGITKFRWLHSRKKYPREQHVARNGKVYAWSSPVGKTDPPGRAIRCGCRSQPLLDFEEGVTDAEVEAAAPTPPAPAAPVAPAPKGPRTGFRSPVNRDVTAESIEVRPRTALQRELAPRYARHADDARYDARPEYRGYKAEHWGKPTFSAAMDDEAVSMVAALAPELDDLAAQLGIPKLRGFRPISGGKAIASQGDGVMNLNAPYFNAYAAQVGGRADGAALAAITEQRAALATEMQPIVDEIRALRARAAEVQYGSSEWQALNADDRALFARLERLRAKDKSLWRKQNVAGGGHGRKPPTAWRPGDGATGRPFTIDAYFETGVEKARTTLYHEFGHHVHQYFGKEGPRRQFGVPPLERDLERFYRREMHADPAAILSKYATTNAKEWFAESFAAYALGRRDLLGPAALELIEGLFNGTY